MTRWLLKFTSGRLDDVSRKQLLESLHCKGKEKATISNTDGLTKFTAGLEDWKDRMGIFAPFAWSESCISFSQILAPWYSAFRVRRRVNIISFINSLAWVALKLHTALPDFNKDVCEDFLLSIAIWGHQSWCIVSYVYSYIWLFFICISYWFSLSNKIYYVLVIHDFQTIKLWLGNFNNK